MYAPEGPRRRGWGTWLRVWHGTRPANLLTQEETGQSVLYTGVDMDMSQERTLVEKWARREERGPRRAQGPRKRRRLGPGGEEGALCKLPEERRGGVHGASPAAGGPRGTKSKRCHWLWYLGATDGCSLQTQPPMGGAGQLKEEAVKGTESGGHSSREPGSEGRTTQEGV